jgi:hypothetical protein
MALARFDPPHQMQSSFAVLRTPVTLTAGFRTEAGMVPRLPIPRDDHFPKIIKKGKAVRIGRGVSD